MLQIYFHCINGNKVFIQVACQLLKDFMECHREAGMIYMHPTNTHISVRVMPGKPHSPLPYQQRPYVIQKKDGQALDKYGKSISEKAPEAHIPLEEFVYRK